MLGVRRGPHYVRSQVSAEEVFHAVEAAAAGRSFKVGYLSSSLIFNIGISIVLRLINFNNHDHHPLFLVRYLRNLYFINLLVVIYYTCATTSPNSPCIQTFVRVV